VGDLNMGTLGGLAMPLASGSFGKLNASGPATLSGTLALSTPGPDPTPTASFQFLTYASRTGRFDTITGNEIVPGRSFSLHYNNSRALAIAGQWAASGQQLAGEFDVPQDLIVSGAWNWNSLLIKRGDGELMLDLDGGFSTTTTAALAIVDGTVRLHGTGRVLALDSLTYGELGQLSGNASLAGEYGWYGAMTAVPEPIALVLVAIGLLGIIGLHPRAWR
jgi:PEP-CTERM motif